MDVTIIYPYLPVIFAGLMGLSILIYVVLDGFDLGVGILFAVSPVEDRDRMIASIGPFWDANETWLVLAIGLMLVAFPIAHGIILTALYLFGCNLCRYRCSLVDLQNRRRITKAFC